MSSIIAPPHLAVALDGAGWHPVAWREPGARPAELFTARYWTDLVREAQRGLLDFVTFEDSFGLQSTRDGADGRVDRVRGRLDATLVAAAVAPRTTGIGLVRIGLHGRSSAHARGPERGFRQRGIPSYHRSRTTTDPESAT